MKLQKILVALANPEEATPILEAAIAVAKAHSSSLRLFHCLQAPQLDYPPVADPVATLNFYGTPDVGLEQFRREQTLQEEEAAQAWLQAYCQQATDQGVIADFACSLMPPGPALCEAAQTWKADLIMVGRRGRSRLTELLLGSVSNHVVHHAPCSVWVVQEPPAQEISQG